MKFVVMCMHNSPLFAGEHFDSLVPCASLTSDRLAEGTRAHLAAMAGIAGALCAAAPGGDSAARAVAAAASAAQPHAAVVTTATAAVASMCALTQLYDSVQCSVASETAAVWAVSSAELHMDAVAKAARGCDACDFTDQELARRLGSATALVEVTGEAFKLTEAVACSGGVKAALHGTYSKCAAVAYTATWVNVRCPCIDFPT